MKEEPVDILDEQGNKTGKVLLKSEAHALGLWHPIAHLWIYSSRGQVLMQKRSSQKKVWPNLWDVAVGGHAAAGESFKDTAVKEAGEELGIKVDPKDLKLICQTKNEKKMPEGWINRIIIWAYIIKLDLDISGLTLEEEEVSDAKWVELDELEKALNNPNEVKNFSPDIEDDAKAAIVEIRKELGL